MDNIIFLLFLGRCTWDETMIDEHNQIAVIGDVEAVERVEAVATGILESEYWVLSGHFGLN